MSEKLTPEEWAQAARFLGESDESGRGPWGDPCPEPPLSPDPGCRWCEGTGMVPLALMSKPCLDCLAPWDGYVFQGRLARAVWLDAEGRQIEVGGVVLAGQPIPPGASPAGRLSRFYRARLDAFASPPGGRVGFPGYQGESPATRYARLTGTRPPARITLCGPHAGA